MHESPIDETNENRIVFPSKDVILSLTLKVAITAIMTALNAVVTMLFAVYLPLTNGFFNVGEAMVYLSAILFGPLIGAFAGGVGGLIADFLLGYENYAWGTLIIKAIEALIVGYLYKLLMKNKEKRHNKTLEVVMVFGISLAVYVMIYLIGYLFYVGKAEISGFGSLFVFNTNFTTLFWFILAGVSMVSIILIYAFVDSQISLKIISMFVGGIFMVVGYYLWARFRLGFALAYTEMPFNILQVCIGITIAVPISGPIKNTQIL